MNGRAFVRKLINHYPALRAPLRQRRGIHTFLFFSDLISFSKLIPFAGGGVDDGVSRQTG
jgi:hypothetical protein